MAQGFKHAANRKPNQSRGNDVAREALKERARDMLRDARFWFSRLTLVHALCLWHLRTPNDGVSSDEPELNPTDLVEHWMQRRDDREEAHPFVIEAGLLAIEALEKGRPEQYLWIDESGVSTTVGSRPDTDQAPAHRHLWIPPSTGWSALDPRAQRLVADVLILLNLGERGRFPAERERRRRRMNRDELPPCITKDRSLLAAGRTIGGAENSAPGANCPGRCDFELCPYPPKGEQTYRAELSEALCRQEKVVARESTKGTWLERLDKKELIDYMNSVPADSQENARRVLRPLNLYPGVPGYGVFESVTDSGTPEARWMPTVVDRREVTGWLR